MRLRIYFCRAPKQKALLTAELQARVSHYNKCFLEKAYPELDLRYFSNSCALALTTNAEYQIILYGRLLLE